MPRKRNHLRVFIIVMAAAGFALAASLSAFLAGAGRQ